jgi:hypothetical protein
MTRKLRKAQRRKPHDVSLKYNRTLDEIAAEFGTQFSSDDCLLVNLSSILIEFGKRRGYELRLPRDRLKEVCAYSHGFGCQSTRVAPNLSIHFKNHHLGSTIEAMETQAGDSSIKSLRKVCLDEITSFPIVGVSPEYWDLQNHLDKKGDGEMDHTLVILRATDVDIEYYDPFQRRTTATGINRLVHRMSTVAFTRIWTEAYMASRWMLWIRERAQTSTLLPYLEEGRTNGR